MGHRRGVDRYIVGQRAAKRAVAVALRNRWRRQQVPGSMRDEISPKNIMLIGPTGVGKTEIARRLARLANAPFVKVEASKFTEVGYVGRDVDSMVRTWRKRRCPCCARRSANGPSRERARTPRSGCSTCSCHHRAGSALPRARFPCPRTGPRPAGGAPVEGDHAREPAPPPARGQTQRARWSRSTPARTPRPSSTCSPAPAWRRWSSTCKTCSPEQAHQASPAERCPRRWRRSPRRKWASSSTWIASPRRRFAAPSRTASSSSTSSTR